MNADINWPKQNTIINNLSAMIMQVGALKQFAVEGESISEDQIANECAQIRQGLCYGLSCLFLRFSKGEAVDGLTLEEVTACLEYLAKHNSLLSFDRPPPKSILKVIERIVFEHSLQIGDVQTPEDPWKKWPALLTVLRIAKKMGGEAFEPLMIDNVILHGKLPPPLVTQNCPACLSTGTPKNLAGLIESALPKLKPGDSILINNNGHATSAVYRGGEKWFYYDANNAGCVLTDNTRDLVENIVTAHNRVGGLGVSEALLLWRKYPKSEDKKAREQKGELEPLFISMAPIPRMDEVVVLNWGIPSIKVAIKHVKSLRVGIRRQMSTLGLVYMSAYEHLLSGASDPQMEHNWMKLIHGKLFPPGKQKSSMEITPIEIDLIYSHWLRAAGCISKEVLSDVMKTMGHDKVGCALVSDSGRALLRDLINQQNYERINILLQYINKSQQYEEFYRKIFSPVSLTSAKLSAVLGELPPWRIEEQCKGPLVTAIEIGDLELLKLILNHIPPKLLEIDTDYIIKALVKVENKQLIESILILLEQKKIIKEEQSIMQEVQKLQQQQLQEPREEKVPPLRIRAWQPRSRHQPQQPSQQQVGTKVTTSSDYMKEDEFIGLAKCYGLVIQTPLHTGGNTVATTQYQLRGILDTIDLKSPNRHVIPMLVHAMTGNIGIEGNANNHWVALIIDTTHGPPQVSYVNPMGFEMGNDAKALLQKYGIENVNYIFTDKMRPQWVELSEGVTGMGPFSETTNVTYGDDNDCGQFLVEALRKLVIEPVSSVSKGMAKEDVASSKDYGQILRGKQRSQLQQQVVPQPSQEQKKEEEDKEKQQQLLEAPIKTQQ